MEEPLPLEEPFTEKAHDPPSATAINVPVAPPPAGGVSTGLLVLTGGGSAVTTGFEMGFPEPPDPPLVTPFFALATGSSVAGGAGAVDEAVAVTAGSAVAVGAGVAVAVTTGTTTAVCAVTGSGTDTAVSAPAPLSPPLRPDITRIAISAGSSTATAASAPTRMRRSAGLRGAA